MNFRNLAHATAGLLLLAFTSLAQITTLEGVVKGTDGKPLQNAVVKIERTDIKGNYQTKTDKKGHYFHTGLPLGFYTISVWVDGKEADKVSGVKTSPGDSRVVDFDLAKSAAANAAVGGAQGVSLLAGGAVAVVLRPREIYAMAGKPGVAVAVAIAIFYATRAARTGRRFLPRAEEPLSN